MKFEDILYPQKDKIIKLNNKGDIGYLNYDGLFYLSEYRMISGVAAIFKKRLTFFENPNTSQKIPTSIIKLLGFRIYKL